MPASKSVKKDDMAAYLAEARSWETDRMKQKDANAKRANIMAGVFGVVAVFSSVSASVLATREPDPPVVLLLDRTRGTVEVSQRLKGGDTTYDEVTNKYWTEQYIRFREGYLRATAEENYNAVGLMSCANEGRKYAEAFSPKNPKSPLNVYGDKAKVNIVVKSTSFINPTTALTRYSREVERAGDKPDVTHWAATTVFKFTGAPMKQKDRGVNPLGFQACEYRVDPDTASGDVRSTVPSDDAPAPIPAPAASGVVLFPGSEPAARQ